MRPPLHRRAPKTARHAALHRMSDLDSENQAPSLDHRVGAAILHALTAIGYAVTSDTRLTMASSIPTYAEMGLPALSYTEWAGFFAPKGTSRDIIAKRNAVAVAALTDPKRSRANGGRRRTWQRW